MSSLLKWCNHHFILPVGNHNDVGGMLLCSKEMNHWKLSYTHNILSLSFIQQMSNKSVMITIKIYHIDWLTQMEKDVV